MIPIPALLDFETSHPVHSGAKEETIRERFGMEPARYYMLLGRALGTMEAARHDPVGVRRIRERLEGRKAEREFEIRCQVIPPGSGITPYDEDL